MANIEIKYTHIYTQLNANKRPLNECVVYVLLCMHMFIIHLPYPFVLLKLPTSLRENNGLFPISYERH